MGKRRNVVFSLWLNKACVAVSHHCSFVLLKWWRNEIFFSFFFSLWRYEIVFSFLQKWLCNILADLKVKRGFSFFFVNSIQCVNFDLWIGGPLVNWVKRSVCVSFVLCLLSVLCLFGRSVGPPVIFGSAVGKKLCHCHCLTVVCIRQAPCLAFVFCLLPCQLILFFCVWYVLCTCALE